MSHGVNQPAENGGGIKLIDAWAKNLLKCMGYVKHKACTTAKIDIEDFDEVKEEFLLEIQNVVAMNENSNSSFTFTRQH